MNGIPPPDALRAQIAERIARSPRDRVGRRARIAIAAAVLLAIVALGSMKARPDLGAASTVGATVAIALLAVGTLVVAFLPGRHGLGASAISLALLGFATLPLYVGITMGAAWAGPGRSVTGCFTLATVSGVVALGGLTFALRRAVPAAAVARGALVGACAGAWAGLMIHLHCPAGDPAHLVVGHAVPLAICTLIGVTALPRLLRP